MILRRVYRDARGRTQLFQLNISVATSQRDRERVIGGEKRIDLCRLIGYHQVELTLY